MVSCAHRLFSCEKRRSRDVERYLLKHRMVLGHGLKDLPADVARLGHARHLDDDAVILVSTCAPHRARDEDALMPVFMAMLCHGGNISMTITNDGRDRNQREADH